MSINLKYGLAGRYKLTAHKVNSQGEIIQSRVAADWFPNLITDIGLDAIGGGTSDPPINGCVVGTGNTTPANTDTSLVSFLAGTGTVETTWAGTSHTSATPYYISYTVTYRFAAGVAAGNLAEVGMCGINNNYHDNSSNLFSRALIVDGTGTPTTITILSDEILDVTYEIDVYMPSGGTDVSGTFNMTIDGTSTTFNYTIRPAIMSSVGIYIGEWFTNFVTGISGPTPSIYPGNYGVEGGYTDAGSLAAVTTFPSGTNTAAWQGSSYVAYTSGNLYMDNTYTMPVDVGNFTFDTMWFGNNFNSYFQMLISPSVVKTSVKKFSITVRFSWARYTP